MLTFWSRLRTISDFSMRWVFHSPFFRYPHMEHLPMVPVFQLTQSPVKLQDERSRNGLKNSTAHAKNTYSKELHISRKEDWILQFRRLWCKYDRWSLYTLFFSAGRREVQDSTSWLIIQQKQKYLQDKSVLISPWLRVEREFQVPATEWKWTLEALQKAILS